MTITLGWWLVPTFITAAVIGFGLIPSAPSHGWGVGTGIVALFQLLVGVIICLAAWLLWAVL